MALFLERARDLRELKTARGAITLWTLTPAIYVCRCIGHLEDAHVDLLLAYSERLIADAHRPIEVFHEWTEVTGYDSSCRSRITSWGIENRKHFDRVHVSVRSKLVRMGVQVANLALGHITAYESTPALQVALRAALRTHGTEVEAS